MAPRNTLHRSSSSIHHLNRSAAMMLLLLLSLVDLQVTNAKIGGTETTSRRKDRRLQLPQFMCSLFGTLVDGLCETGEEEADDQDCKAVKPLSNDTGVFDLERFTAHSWFVQKQQVNGFQYSPEDDFYCLAMTYMKRDDDNDNNTDDGDFYNFYNYGITGGGVNGSIQAWDGDETDNWCAGQDRYGGGLLRISPCVLAPLLVRVGIPQWILAVSDDYSWAIMSGGEPSELIDVDVLDGDDSSGTTEDQDDDEEQHQSLCTTRTNVTDGVLVDTSGAGLWLLTRERVASNDTINEMEQILLDMGIYTGELFPVVQEGCGYNNATLLEE